MSARSSLPALAFALLLLVACTAGAAPATSEPATLYVLNREVITFRAELLGAKPVERVDRARARLRQIPESAIDRPISKVKVESDVLEGMQFYLG